MYDGVATYLMVFRYATTSARSHSFLKPGKAILVPLANSFGFARKTSRFSGVHSICFSLRAFVKVKPVFSPALRPTTP